MIPVPPTPTTPLDDLKDLLGNLFIPFAGAVMLGWGVVAGWMTVDALRRGWFDDRDGIIYLAQEPIWFSISTVIFAAMGLGCAWLGVEMLIEGWRQRRDSARLAKRLLHRKPGASQ